MNAAAVEDDTTEWLCGDISREAAEELVVSGGATDGDFLVRTRKTKGQYVLCVVFKGKPTHHLIGTSEDGVLLINKLHSSGAVSLCVSV